MKKLIGLWVILLFGFLLGGCTSPAERKAEAEAQLYEQKTEAVKEYRACLKKYEGKEDQAKVCEAYRQAAETLAK